MGEEPVNNLMPEEDFDCFWSDQAWKPPVNRRPNSWNGNIYRNYMQFSTTSLTKNATL